MSEKTLLSYFWDLASTNEKIRIDAGVRLIEHLRTRETKDENGNKEEMLTHSNDLTYALKRLVKGLGSSRKAARQGFAMALTEILLQFNSIQVKEIMKVMKEALVVTKSCSSQEERDAYFGQIFALVTLGRVICLSDEYGNTNISKLSLKPVIEGLKELISKKSFLHEICYKAISDIMEKLTVGDFQEYVFPLMEDDIKCSWDKCSSDRLVLILATWRLFKDEIGHKTFKKTWKNSHLDSVENYPSLAKILQNSHNSHPRVHCVWAEVLHLVLNSSRTNFKGFWKTVIDENLFQSSHERKFLGFKLLEKVLPMLSVEQVEVVFSPQLMHCLFNSLQHDTNYLYTATKQMVEGIGQIIISNGKQMLIVEVIKQLLGRNGNICFDAVTKTKAVENLLPKIPIEDLPNLVSWMKAVFTAGDVDTSSEPKNVEKTREGILGLFLLLIRCKQLPHTSSWVLEAVYFVFENAYFSKIKNDVACPTISHQTRVVCQQRFNSILGELASLSDKPKTPALPNEGVAITGPQKTFGLADDGCLWISHIMHRAKVLLKSQDFQLAEDNWGEEVHSIFTRTMKLVKKLEQKFSASTLENRAFIMLFLYVGVQLFSEPQQAQEILEEVFQCFERVKSQVYEETQGNEPPWIDVVTEILVSFLTESSNLRRQVVNQVFNIIVPHLTPSALNIILEALAPRNGLNEVSTLQVETASDSENEEEMESDGHQSENGADSDDENMSDNNENASDENEEQDSVDPLFKVDLQAALGDALANQKDDDNGDDKSDDDLDDEAMMKFDDALSEVFKQHLKAKDEKKKTKDAKKSILHFKLRVLDLVEILIKKQSSSLLILELIQPLLDIIRASLSSKDYVTLGERAQGIFKNKLCAIKEHAEHSPSYIENVHCKIELLLEQTMKAPSVSMVTLMSTGCLFLIRQLHEPAGKGKDGNEGKRNAENSYKDEFRHLDLPRIKTAYCETLKDFMVHRNTHLHPLLFQELINRFPAVGWLLAEDLVNYVTQGINNFRKIQACMMLSQLLNKKVLPYMDHLKNLVTPLQEAFHTIFSQLTSSDDVMKAKHLRQILKLAMQFVKRLKGEPNIWSSVDFKSLEESLDVASKSKTVERAHDLKHLINQLCSEISGEATKEVMKSKKKKKRKKNQDEIASDQKNSENDYPMVTKKSKMEKEVSPKRKNKKKQKKNKE